MRLIPVSGPNRMFCRCFYSNTTATVYSMQYAQGFIVIDRLCFNCVIVVNGSMRSIYIYPGFFHWQRGYRILSQIYVPIKESYKKWVTLTHRGPVD